MAYAPAPQHIFYPEVRNPMPMIAKALPVLLELEEYLTSGRLAEDFMESSERRRHEMLEFLEKFMDVAELADEVVTQIIFRRGEKDGA